ncbi:MAG: hypothetical protein EXS46_02245 [Candidatus Taylorbacteria bacterium]|nr:hypothetical protein [Candidatus Taylorbacteria bacterium]
MNTALITVPVNYSVSELDLRRDLTLCGHYFIPYAPPPINESVGNGEHKISFKIWWGDKAQTFEQIMSFIKGTGCRHSTQVEMRSLAQELLGGLRHNGTCSPGYFSPFQCFGTVWTLPSEPSSAIPLLMNPCFTLHSLAVEWDLPVAEGLFPSSWNYVGVVQIG